MRLKLHTLHPDDIFFTGDTHFGHKLLQRLRGFTSTEEMDQCLISNINEVVQPHQWLVHVGDFALERGPSLRQQKHILAWLKQIQCKHIIYIYGNHDQLPDHFYRSIFTYCADLADITIGSDKLPFTACHYALRVWNKSHYGAWHVYGHSHGSLKDNQHSLSTDVGVDAHAYKPVSWQQLETIMSKKTFQAPDYH